LFLLPMLLPPPRSTLFPYTTLFRSLQLGSTHKSTMSAGRRLLRIRRSSGPNDGMCSPIHVDCQRYSDCMAPSIGSAALSYQNAGDRKSTRLNSSHLGISYAVFCLKK